MKRSFSKKIDLEWNEWPRFKVVLVGCYLFLALFSNSCLLKEGRSTPVVQDGIIDLSNWNFEEKGNIDLSGNWRFVEGKLVDPAPISELRAKYQSLISVPAIWQVARKNAVTHGSYILEINMPPGAMNGEVPLGIKFNKANSAARIEVWDEEAKRLLLRIDQGLPAETVGGELPVLIAGVDSIGKNASSRLLMLIYVSSHRNVRGGIYNPIEMGFSPGLKNDLLIRLVATGFLIGALFFIAIYHLMIYTQRPEDKSALAFTCFCLAMAFREIIISQILEQVGIGHSLLGFDLLTMGSYLSMPLMVMGGGFFVVQMVPGPFINHFYYRFVIPTSAVAIISTLITDPIVFSGFLYFHKFWVLLVSGIGIIYLAVRSWQKDRLAQWIGLSLFLVVMTAVNDILYNDQILDTGYYTPYSFLIFVLIQSVLVSRKSAEAFRKAKHLSEHLEEEVKSQTLALADKTKIAMDAKEEADQLKEKAEDQAKVLTVLDKQKTVFFQNVSHELRTPLTLILNPLEHQARSLPDNNDIQVAVKNARRLLRLVNQLLDFQKIEAGKKDLKMVTIDLNWLVHVCAEHFGSACTDRGISFSVIRNGVKLCIDGEPLLVKGEIDAFEKVIFNYLANALKYSSQNGHIELGLETKQNRVRLYVKDNGVGIPKDTQEKLFEIFSRVDLPTEVDYEGSGLGLALVKALVKEMNGSVGLESEPDKGSMFWADFDIVTPDRQTVAILVVEDDMTLRCNLIDSLLENLDLEDNQVYGKDSVEEAMAFLEEYSVCCVISDLNLKGKDGLEFMHQVAQQEPDAYRILMTAEAGFDVLERAVNEKLVHHVFYKGSETHNFMTQIEKVVGEKLKEREELIGTPKNEENFKIKPWLLAEIDFKPVVEDVVPDEVKVSADESLILVVDDLADMRELMAETLQAYDYAVVKAANGKQGLEAIKQHKPDLVISDWMMPEMTGPEMIECLKADPNLSNIPVILLTAKTDEESKLLGTSIGADAFLGKPFNEQELLSMVKNLIQLMETSKRELRHTKNLLTQADKMSQLGEMIASIGHEIANPISLISLEVYNGKSHLKTVKKILKEIFLAHDLEDQQTSANFEKQLNHIVASMENIQLGSDRLKDLSLALRTQARFEQKPTPGVNLNEIIGESLLITGGRMNRHEVTKSLGDVPGITCFRSRIGQVVTNLLVNAADALLEKLERNIKIDDSFIGRISLVSKPCESGGQPGVSLVITDNGDGVPDMIREKIFEQFFTTKEAGKGTGLGLSLCLSIVREHGGHIEVTNDPDLGGARFELWLPVIMAGREAA